MIKTWSLQHFKSVFERTDLEITPLTIFTGANNSGKSTIIQSMLLTAQTIQNSVYSRSVVLNGHITRLGTFDDIASSKEDTKEISIGFELFPSEQEQKSARRMFWVNQQKKNMKPTLINCNYSFISEGSDDSEVVNLNPILKSSEIRVHNDSDIRFDEIVIRRRDKNFPLNQLGVSQKYIDSFEDVLEYEVIKMPLYNRGRNPSYRNRNLPNSGEPVGASLQHFLPSKITLIYDLIEEEVSNAIKFCLHPDKYYYNSGTEANEVTKYFNEKVVNLILEIINQLIKSNEGSYTEKRATVVKKSIDRLTLAFSIDKLRRCFNSFLAEDQKKYYMMMEEKENRLKELAKLGKVTEHALLNAELPDNIQFATEYITWFFANNVKYLGPLRDEPKPIYSHTGTTDSQDVGYKGEHTAAVLEIHRNTIIEYIPPDEFEKKVNTYDLKKETLINAVLDWLNYMGVVNNVKTIDRGKLGHELKVSTNEDGKLHDLTHVGVGVSQVLPILVLSLLSTKGSTLIFEQPELHLHPRVQTRLADFFVSMFNLGKQCIVETHSEYLINRLRYHAVVSDNNGVTEKVIMYFVEKEAGKSQYKPIRINRFGVIEEWPKGFFDENEATSAAILKAALSKRKKESEI